MFCGPVVLKCPAYILEGKATLKKFMQFYAIFDILKGMGHNIGSFEILLQLLDFRGHNWIF